MKTMTVEEAQATFRGILLQKSAEGFTNLDLLKHMATEMIPLPDEVLYRLGAGGEQGDSGVRLMEHYVRVAELNLRAAQVCRDVLAEGHERFVRRMRGGARPE